MILFEKEQPFEGRIVPLPCFIITNQEKEEALKNLDIRLLQRDKVLAYLDTQSLLDKIWVFEEDGILYTSFDRSELYQKQHQIFCKSLDVIYQVPETMSEDLEKCNYYQINIKQSESIPADGFSLYRNGFEIATNIMSLNHAIELAYSDAINSLEKLKLTLEERLKNTHGLLKLLKEHGLNLEERKFSFNYIDETNQCN